MQGYSMDQFATPSGTQRYAKRFCDYKEFYAQHEGLLFSKLGLGTFVKEPYKEENYEFSFKDVIKSAIQSGINVIDTANNYRYGVSEKEVGEAVAELVDQKIIARDEVIIASKGGFIPLCYPFPKNPYRWIEDNILHKGLAKPSDIELDQHCLSASYMEHSCKQSLKNMGIDCLDIYYIHNPEMQLMSLGYDKLLMRMQEIFAQCEKMRKQGLIKSYGVASWNGFLHPLDAQEHLGLQDLVALAQNVGGDDHGFKYIQTPFNLAKVQALTLQNQDLSGVKMNLFQAASKLGIAVVGSCSLLQMNLFQKPFKPEVGYLLDKQMKLTSDVQLALQFVRSTPGVLTSLFSTTRVENLEHNMQIAQVKAIKKSEYDLLFRL